MQKKLRAAGVRATDGRHPSGRGVRTALMRPEHPYFGHDSISSMPKRSLALSVVLTLAAAGCGVLPAKESAPPPATTTPPSSAPTTSAPPASATASGQDARPALAETRSTETPNLKVEVIGLNRVKAKHLIAQIRLSNTGTEKNLPWSADMGDRTRPLGAMQWASGIGILDAQARTWILPYTPAGSPCLCSDQKRDGLDHIIDPGQSITLYAVLPAPSGNPATTTVVTPVAPPMLNVPISDQTPTGDFPDPDTKPVTPITRRLILPSESLDKTEETADDGKDLQINLSADVLFAVGGGSSLTTPSQNRSWPAPPNSSTLPRHRGRP